MAISAKIDNENVSVDGFAIPISGLNAGTYNLTVTTIPDDNHNPVTEIATIRVNKINSSINVNDTVIYYGDIVSVDVTVEGAMGITAELDGEVIIFNGYSVPIPILNAGVHYLTVSTIPDGNHLEVNKTVTITVNKVNSTVGINNIVLVIGNSTNITVATDGAIGISAKINDTAARVFNYSIEIPILELGNYTLTVTTVPDGNHNPVTKTVNLTVKKPDSILTVENIVFKYNSVGVAAMSFKGATGVNAKIINQSDALIDIKDDEIIIVSTLKPGTYTLEVTTIPDDDHDPVTRIVNITVEKLESTLTVEDIAFDYNGAGSAAVSFEGASGVAAEVVGQPNAVVSVKANTISVSGLDAGT